MDCYRADTAKAIAVTEQSTLDHIAERILKAARDAREIGIKLNDHADRVHGPVPTGQDAIERADKPAGAIERIFMALNDLDSAQSYMAEAAGRNTTLA